MQGTIIFISTWLAACWLTRKVDGDRLAASVGRVNAFFIYGGERSRLERWRVLSLLNPVGD